MFSPSRNLTLEGQSFLFNPNTKTVILEITQPFLTAGKKLGWDIHYGTAGFGINQSIVRFIQKSKSKLLVHNLENSRDYWTTHDRLNAFIHKNTCIYTVSGKPLFVFPWKIFATKVDQLGVLQ